MCICNIRPSVTVNIVAQFNDFLKDTAKNDADRPDSLQKLQNEAGCRLILTDTNDPDGVGCFVQWRVAFYIAGDNDQLLNFFHLLDSYFQHKAKQFARASPFEVHVYPYVDVDI